jgi:hypothetical protein
MTVTGGVERGARGGPEHEALVFPILLRRVQRMFLVRDVSDSFPAAVTLFGAGALKLGDPSASAGQRVLAVAELASSAWMIFFVGRRVRAVVRRREATHVAPAASLRDLAEEHGRVEWSGVAGAVMLGVGLWQHWTETGRVQRPVLLVALFTLFMATRGRLLIARAVQGRFGDRRPRLALSAEGIDYRATRRRRFSARWDEVARVEHDAAAVAFALHDGRTFALRARDHVDGAALVAAVRAALPELLPPTLRS